MKRADVVVSQLELLNKSPAELEQLAGERVDAADVRARMTWVVDAANATQEEFAHRLAHCEPPPATFHATLAAVLSVQREPLGASRKRAAPEVPLLVEWLQLEAAACKRKLLTRRASLPAVCTRYDIVLLRRNSKPAFKFPHQEKFIECTQDELCQLLANHGLARAPSVRYAAEVPASARAEAVRLLEAVAEGKRAKK